MTNETCTVDLEVCLFTSILQIPVIVSALYHERNPQYSSEAQDLPWHIFQSKDEACGSHPWLYIWITCKVFVSVVSTVVSTLLFQCWVSTVVSTLLFQYWRLDLIPRKVGSNKKKRKKMWVHVSGEGQYFLTFLNWSQDGEALDYCCCSVGKSCLTLCDPVDSNVPGFPVLHYLPEFAQTHVHWVSDAIQPSHPLLPTSPFAFHLC